MLAREPIVTECCDMTGDCMGVARNKEALTPSKNVGLGQFDILYRPCLTPHPIWLFGTTKTPADRPIHPSLNHKQHTNMSILHFLYAILIMACTP
jgi:hypothetical protein